MHTAQGLSTGGEASGAAAAALLPGGGLAILYAGEVCHDSHTRCTNVAPGSAKGWSAGGGHCRAGRITPPVITTGNNTRHLRTLIHRSEPFARRGASGGGRGAHSQTHISAVMTISSVPVFMRPFLP